MSIKTAQDIKKVELSSSVTVEVYEDMVDTREKKKIAGFVRERFTERYILPVIESKSKNGFAMMSTACLMIETLESFYQGWENTARMEHDAFKLFLRRETHLGIPQDHIASFYKGVRCGLLHQGETTRGWTITRKSKAPIFDALSLTIQAEKFLREGIGKSLEIYCKKLEDEEWDSECWDNFRRKMRSVIRNCERVD
jgi:hypothetical protein